jgi:hypothetical protein
MVLKPKVQQVQQANKQQVQHKQSHTGDWPNGSGDKWALPE